MSTTWASKISWILSPTRSYMPCISSCAARPCCTLLMMASSAARWRVSAMRRAFSRATLRLALSVFSRSTSDWLKASSWSRFWIEMTPVVSPPTMRGAKSDAWLGSPWIPGGCPYSAATPPAARVAAEADERHGLVREANAALDGVGEAHQAGILVVDADIDDLGVEDVLDLVANEVVHGLHVELRRQALLDAVDDGQLGSALVGLGQQALRLVEEAGVLERDAHARGQGAQHAGVGFAEGGLLEALERPDAEDAVAGQDGHAQPRFGPDVPDEDGPVGEALVLGPDPEWLSRLDDDRGQPLAHRDRVGVVALTFLDLVRELDHVRRRVVEGDERRPRLEQAAHALADELGDGLEVELRRESAADLVDERQLRGALVGLGQQALRLVEQAGVRQRHAHA